MKFENALFKGMIILFLVLSSDIFSSDTIRKEVKLFSTFEDFIMNNPVKIYQTDNEYNSDKKIKSNQGLIKVIEEKQPTGEPLAPTFLFPLPTMTNICGSMNLDSSKPVVLKRWFALITA